MRFLWLRRNEGSVTPLILGFAIVLVAVIATLSDLTYLRNAHLSLKSEGQEVLAQSMRHLSAEDYYNGISLSGTSVPGTSVPGTSVPGTSASGTSASGTSASGTSVPGTSASGTSASGTSASGTSASGTSVPIDCRNTFLNILTALKEIRFYMSNQPITIRGFTCINSWIEFEISTSVLLPFNPRFLEEVDPTVTSLIRGGSRYFSD
jgi:hypothetical protein